MVQVFKKAVRNEYALVTGASRGIGKAIAQSLARAGYNVLLVSRSAEELKELSASISLENNVEALYLPVDLSIEGSASQVLNWCKDLAVPLAVLVNNAGYGLWNKFEDLSLDDQFNMLKLNIDAVVGLSHALLPLLEEQKKAYILNVSSTAAYQAVPTLALYAASKSFVLSFSRALRYELKGSGVSVTCLCPGPTDTGFVSRAGMDAIAEMAEKFNMSAGEVALTGLKGMFRGKAEIIPGFLNKLTAFAARHLPKSWVEYITSRLYQR